MNRERRAPDPTKPSTRLSAAPAQLAVFSGSTTAAHGRNGRNKGRSSGPEETVTEEVTAA
jgi:hypothetical protein